MNNSNICDTKNRDMVLKEFLHHALKEIISITQAECGSLFLLDPCQKELVLDSLYNSEELHLHGIRQRLGEGVAGKVADIKTPILVKDIKKDSRFQRNGFGHYKTDSFISIPLLTSRGLLGLINLADKSSGEPFSDKDLECAVVISEYACLSIEISHNCIAIKKEREALDKQNVALEKYASIGKLAAGIVHEINNPLDGIIRYTNMLLNQMEDDSVGRDYLLDIKKGLAKIVNITKSLLEFSHQVNSIPQTKEYIDVHKLIDEALDIFTERINVNVKVRRQYKEGLPRILDLNISHVFRNIIKNALDAISDYGILEISTDIKDNMLEIGFKDTGLGITNNIRERIFEPFFTTKGINNGNGLGLAISKEIINKYEGSIEVDSVEGKGSKFTILIPKKYLENA